MKNINKNSNQNDKIKKKRESRVKRKISILTIMLWIFLISTIITITVNSTKKTNALEVEDENWNIGLVMYDRSSDTPNQAITEFTWNAVNRNETKQLCMQINYACTTNKGYQPGEIEITIPGIAKDSFSERRRNDTNYQDFLEKKITIAADKISDTIKKYDWSYIYDEDNNIYIFTNNIIVAENEHFEGTIQIVYNLFPQFRIKTDLEYKAKIKENIENSEEIIAKESNICNFHYTSTKTVYTLKNNAIAGAKADYTKIEDILNEYYWVRYDYSYNISANIIDAIDANGNYMFDRNSCIKLKLPEGVVIYDYKLNRLESKENNTYYYLYDSGMHLICAYYIGYPKNKYNDGDSVTNIAELWGRYEDEEEIEKLSEASSTVSLVDFDFEYKGDLYGINKRAGYAGSCYISSIKNLGDNTYWRINPKIFYTDSIMDIEIGDDLLYITRENGEVTKLNDNEYNFTKIKIPMFYTYNKYNGSSGDKLIGYKYEIQVRYKDTNEYVVYSEDTTSSSDKTITFDREDIVGVKLLIKDLDKTLYEGDINVYTNIHTRDCGLGSIYNFGYLQVYKKDNEGNRTLANVVTQDSYNTPSTLKIAESDINIYGRYMQRSFTNQRIVDGVFRLVCSKNVERIDNNPKDEKYEIKYILSNSLSLDHLKVEKDVIIKTYDILPIGMNLISTKEEITDSIFTGNNFEYYKLKLKNGDKFNNRFQFEEYIRNNTIVDIDYNYRSSGRTKISVIYNLNEIDWSYYLEDRMQVMSNISFILDVNISYDSILEYGTSYKNYIYTMWNNQEYSYYNSKLDNGYFDILASDIDNDGNVSENLECSNEILSITHAVSSQQAVIKQVRTDLTKGKFIEETAEATAGSEYTYKLRVTTGANSLKDLILYDTLETIYDEQGNDISSGWKGKFLGVDTTYALSKGYAPKVYYSEEKNPGKLTEVPEKWMELTDEVDKSTVKSVCVDLRYKADGSDMELSANNVVFVLINMQAPEDDTLLTSANNMFSTNWRVVDPFGTVIDNVEGIYSNQVNVEIHKEDIRTNISGTKTWNDLDNKYMQRPESITVKLLQDGHEYETKTVTAEDNWQYTFENIPVYASNTREYEYEIIEDEVSNYETTYDGYNITNSIKLKDIEVTKIWEDNNNEAGKRPSSIILQVFDSNKLIKEAEVNEESEWKYTFTNLLKYREDGSEINYRIDEKSFENDKFYTKEIVGNVVTNRFTVPENRIKIVGTKIWEDSEDFAKKRPESVILQVIANSEVITEAEVNESNNWSYEFELAKYDELGNEIEYYIDERDIGSKFYKKIFTDKNTVTNEFVVPEEVTLVKAVKKWVDKNNEYLKRPKSVVLQVYDGDKLVVEEKVSADNNWSYEFKLPKYDEYGDEILYRVDEKTTSKYYEKTVEGYTVINKCIYEPVIDTSDINVLLYIVVFLVSTIGIVIKILFGIKNKIDKKIKK